MSGTEAAPAKIARIEERVGRQRADITKSEKRLAAVEMEQGEVAKDRIRDQSKFDEIGTQFESLRNTIEDAVEGIEKVDTSIDEKLTKIADTVAKTQGQVGAINNRLTVIEANRFDIVRVFKWLGTWLNTWRGTFFLCFVFSVTVGVVFPNAQDFILDVLGIATKAKSS